MIVLGINENHNATAALIKDGRVLYAASEERITRLKNDVGYPHQTIRRALAETGLAGPDIDYVVYTSALPLSPIDFKIKRITTFKIADYVREMHEHWKPLLIEKKPSTFWEKIMREPRFQNLENQYYDLGFLETITIIVAMLRLRITLPISTKPLLRQWLLPTAGATERTQPSGARKTENWRKSTESTCATLRAFTAM